MAVKDRKPRTIDVALKDIKQTVFVRQKLSDDRVMYFAELYDEGKPVPPIELTPDYQVVDGRNRIAGADLAKMKTIPAIILDTPLTKTDIIWQAVEANKEGPEPFKPVDMEVIIRQLLQEGVGRTQIEHKLALHSSFPGSLVRRFVANVRLKLNAELVVKAKNAVLNDGMTVPIAAKKYGIEDSKLREALGDKRKKAPNIVQLEGNLSRSFHAFGVSIERGIMSKVKDLYEDGELKEQAAVRIYLKGIDLAGSVQRNRIEAYRRFCSAHGIAIEHKYSKA